MTHIPPTVAIVALATLLTACDFQQASYYDRYDHGAEIDFGEDMSSNTGDASFDFSGAEFDKVQQRRKSGTTTNHYMGTTAPRTGKKSTPYYRGSDD